MARDAGMEALVLEEIGHLSGLTTRAMFGGLAWMLDDHLLCGARETGLMARLGKGNDGWALEHEDVSPLMGDRAFPGWVRAGPDAISDDAFPRRLLQEAVRFVRSLPPKA